MSAIARNEEGYLLNWQDWTPSLAEQLAKEQTILLQETHWQIIHFVREFYEKYQYSPIQRLIVKQLKTINEQASSNDLLKLFPNGPRQICFIAGLPKPARCV